MIEMEYPEETEETEPEIEDLDATRVIPDVTKQDAWHATPGDTQEFNLEEELKAALSGNRKKQNGLQAWIRNRRQHLRKKLLLKKRQNR